MHRQIMTLKPGAESILCSSFEPPPVRIRSSMKAEQPYSTDFLRGLHRFRGTGNDDGTTFLRDDLWSANTRNGGTVTA
jgi:hypothetical protein